MLVLGPFIYPVVFACLVTAADPSMTSMIKRSHAPLYKEEHWNNLIPSSSIADVSGNPTAGLPTISLGVANEKREDQSCVSVHLCTEKDWKGDCWWACFRDGLETYPNWDWGSHVKSARPGEDAKCKFFFGPDCSMRSKKQDMEWPGGNFERLGDFGIGCFYCMMKGSKKSYLKSD
ncbi:hypothetical protein CORC01_07454 [Colletotrichum orchidophilum]|uniref:Uncharacterized protein n=1 Tax=Colletotrichum orchidophilum TaxID=1209926 RepID=A0A1G4B6X3_9PEZI|nr:uncharacterized protein CORC01_07454 [Colletotrichum orchidophilum]OHE97200.1 hypothetical protein CORC01_07454 [Colletotrichum orchidophilum]